MTDHEIRSVDEVFLDRQDDKPTLWDTDGPGRQRAVALTKDDGHILIMTDPETVQEYLG